MWGDDEYLPTLGSELDPVGDGSRPDPWVACRDCARAYQMGGDICECDLCTALVCVSCWTDHAAEHRREEEDEERQNRTPSRLQVFIYAKCSHCMLIAQWLEERGLPFDLYHIEEHPEARELAESEGVSSVPFVVEVTDMGLVADVWGGFEPGRLEAWARRQGVSA